MSATFRMPSLGADMEAGTLVEWLKRPGDEVHRGDIIAVVETQKGAIEVECFDDGVIAELLVEPDTEVPVGTALATIRAEGEEAGSEQSPAERREPEATVAEPQAASRERPAASPAAPAAGQSPPATASSGAPDERPRASPAARRLAAEKGVDLTAMRGSGPDGAIVSVDVLSAATAQPRKTGEKPPRGLDLAEMRKAIAAAMAKSKREIPHYYLSHEVDLEAALDWVTATNAERAPQERLLPGAVLLKAAAVALGRFPELNGFWEDGAYRPAEAVHLGVAVSLRGGGLIAPAIHGVHELALDDFMGRMRDLVGRARTGHLRSSELTDATATVSSLGDRGVDSLYGVIYPPQVALIGFGRPTARPRVIDDEVAVRRGVTVTLAGDHRASDGHRGALFLAEVAALLQQPEAL